MIEVCDLSKVFPGADHKAVDNVSFKLFPGEVCSIIGTSGCGKTTTLKMINRLIEPSSGGIWVDDVDSKDVDLITWRRKFGYVIQKAGLLPHLNIAENISLLSKMLGKSSSEIRARVEELMDVIEMPYEQFATRYPVELSGGQQQRVGIARALMEDPSVLLMDEPFGALDPITRDALHAEFLMLNKKFGKTILIVTHDMTEAFKLADKIILMNEGKVVQFGTEKDFFESPRNEFVENFIKGKVH